MNWNNFPAVAQQVYSRNEKNICILQDLMSWLAILNRIVYWSSLQFLHERSCGNKPVCNWVTFKSWRWAFPLLEVNSRSKWWLIACLREREEGNGLQCDQKWNLRVAKMTSHGTGKWVWKSVLNNCICLFLMGVSWCKVFKS